MARTFLGHGMGWLPDYPDIRDYTPQHEKIAPMLAKTGLAEVAGRQGPEGPVDLRAFCPPVEDQGEIGSCTANAGVGLVEYFERRAFGKHLDASRLFLYKTTRNLLHETGDSGAFIRTTMGALALFGVPPEEYWPYAAKDFDLEPPAFCYSFAQAYRTLSYFRLDPPGTSKESLLAEIKSHLSTGLPCIFGFTVYESIAQAGRTGRIPYPSPAEKVLGGHAMMAVGFDDKLKIKNADARGAATTGALLVRNSWGTGWGEEGYGWLPYAYVKRGLAVDWWTLLRNEWLDTGEFGLR